jgi:hypothetical protein
MMSDDDLSKLVLAALVVSAALETLLMYRMASSSGPVLVSLQIEEEEACGTARSSTIEKMRTLRARFMAGRGGLLLIQ